MHKTALVFFYLETFEGSVPACVLALDSEGAAIVWDDRLLHRHRGAARTQLATWIYLVYVLGRNGVMEANLKLSLLRESLEDSPLDLRGLLEVEHEHEDSGIKVAHHWFKKAMKKELFPAP